MNLDRMDEDTARYRRDYLIWQRRGYSGEMRLMIKSVPSVQHEVYLFLCKCEDFALGDRDGTVEMAEEIRYKFMNAPCPVRYAEQFDPTLRRK